MDIISLLSNDLLSLSGLLTSQVAIGGIVGFFMGFAIKKITKIAIFALGFFFLILVYLEYQGFISINYDKITETIQNVEGDVINPDNITNALPFLQPFFLNIPSMAGFGAGFVLGLKKG
ncbi:MAG: hypothetical protein KatS3mg003_1232 [Candidatus Nitrosocaldaceae archaeon]|nr:MAG: hypothetical protein KatS3mg003_1232 [Candidatus Nitrosocaldaceae archaeon]